MTGNIFEQTLNHWILLIEPFFPKNTRFVAVDTKERFCIYIQVPFENPDEGYRISNRTIILIFTDEAINEYIHNYETGSHRKADIRLKELMATKLMEQMSESDISPKDQVPEYWIITTDILNR